MLSKYYSLDECSDRDVVFDHLEALKEEGKVVFSTIDNDVIRIKDTGLTLKETKELVKFLEENDVISYDDFQPTSYMEEEDEFDDEDWEDDGDDYEEDEY